MKDEISLRIEIRNKQPIELIELTKSFIAISNQYTAYASNNASTEIEREARLYIKEIKSGSVILDLMEIASASVIPFLENTNTIIGFADYCKKAINVFLNKDKEMENYTVSDCKDFSAIVNPIAKDNGAQLNMSTNVNGVFNQYVFLDSKDSNALQNIIDLKKPEIAGTREKVVLAFYQTRNSTKGKTGNKAIVDDIEKGKPVNVIFANTELKQNILKGENNPNNFGFLVDVKIETVSDKIVAYRILKLHDIFPLN
jgi:hypothetical protein